MIDVNQLKSSIDCRDLISTFSPLSGKGSEWFGPCPWCGGNDRFHVTVDGWWCRAADGHCGRKGDAIRFVQEYKDLTFPRAAEWLSGWQGGAPASSPVRQDRKKDAPAIDWRGADWQAMARKEVTDCAARLDKHNGGPYLAGRCIVKTTAAAYCLGYNSHGYYGKTDGKHDLRPEVRAHDGDSQHVRFAGLSAAPAHLHPLRPPWSVKD